MLTQQDKQYQYSINTIPKRIYAVHAYVSHMKKLDLDQVVVIEETGITVRGYRRRTTVPSKIFEFLKLKDGDGLKWVATKDGIVFVTKIAKK